MFILGSYRNLAVNIEYTCFQIDRQLWLFLH